MPTHDHVAERVLCRAQRLCAGQRHDEAERCLRDAFMAAPGHPRLARELLSLLAARGRLGSDSVILDHALEALRDDPDALFAHGRRLDELGLVGHATRWLVQAHRSAMRLQLAHAGSPRCWRHRYVAMRSGHAVTVLRLRTGDLRTGMALARLWLSQIAGWYYAPNRDSAGVPFPPGLLPKHAHMVAALAEVARERFDSPQSCADILLLARLHLPRGWWAQSRRARAAVSRCRAELGRWLMRHGPDARTETLVRGIHDLRSERPALPRQIPPLPASSG